MKKNSIKQILRKIFFKVLQTREYKPIKDTKNILKKRKIFNVLGGKLNPEKNFYVIQRHPGYGIFSNLTFVINHIKIALDMGFIPIVDMENFTTIYNEKKKYLILLILGNTIMNKFLLLSLMKFTKVKIL